MREKCASLSLLCVLCALCVGQVRGVFDGTCMRKDPPPGVLVLSPGSKLVLTCRGHVMVNGVTVNIARNSSNTNRKQSPSVAPTTARNSNNTHTVGSTANDLYHTNSGVSTVTKENRIPRYTETGSTVSPATQTLLKTTTGRVLKTESSWVGEEMKVNDEYEEEDEGEEGNRVTRGINPSHQWKLNGKMVGKGKRDWGEISFERRGSTLSLSSVRLTDSGSYTCHHRSTQRFSLKVIVADPPKKPSLYCYKKSPSSKIRCESEPQEPTTRPFSCYLVLNKRSSETFHPLQCSYSPRFSRYWCALEHNEDEQRTFHTAYLCVTGIAGNATSSLLSFTPLGILKPDPPSGVKVHQVEGRETYIKVTWNFPVSWKSQDSYYKLVYDIRYKPKISSFHYEQRKLSDTMTSEITDVMPGVEYLIEVRTKDEYDGHWSSWSPPVSGRSWTVSRMSSVVHTTTLAVFTEEGSTFLPEFTATEPTEVEVSYHTLWISGSFLLLSVILAAYIFRHKDRFLTKLHHLSVITQHSDSSQPPPPSPEPQEVQVLVTFAPPCYKEPPLSETEEAEEENEEEDSVEDRIETMHFNNTSYFLLHTE